MTEHEWLTSDSPAAMLAWLQDGMYDGVQTYYPPSARKLRLIGLNLYLAYCIQRNDKHGGMKQDFDWIDGIGEIGPRFRWNLYILKPSEFAQRSVELYTLHDKDPKYEYDMLPVSAACEIIRAIIGDPFNPVTLDPSPVGLCQRTVCRAPGSRWRHTQTGYLYCEGCARTINGYHRAELGRDLIESPRGCPWLTSDVLAIATRIYTDRDWDAMPMLADALETSGCEDVRVLEWLRGETDCGACGGDGIYIPAENEDPAVVGTGCKACSGTGRIKPVRCRGDHVLDAILGRE